MKKLLSWIHNKLNGYTKSNTVPSPSNVKPESASNEEFSEWPQELFAIGTLGSDKATENPQTNTNPRQQNPPPSSALTGDLTPEEVGSLGKELMSLLGKQEESVLKEELTTSSPEPNSAEDGNLQRPKKGERLRSTSKRSLSFFLKKVFVCRSGFPPIPASLRDPPSEPRISKMLKVMLKKKIYPHHNSSQAVYNKRFLESRQSARVSAEDDEANGEGSSGSTWVRTDSEYIVLEI